MAGGSAQSATVEGSWQPPTASLDSRPRVGGMAPRRVGLSRRRTASDCETPLCRPAHALDVGFQEVVHSVHGERCKSSNRRLHEGKLAWSHSIDLNFPSSWRRGGGTGQVQTGLCSPFSTIRDGATTKSWSRSGKYRTRFFRFPTRSPWPMTTSRIGTTAGLAGLAQLAAFLVARRSTRYLK